MSGRARIAALHDRLDALFGRSRHEDVARLVGVGELTVARVRSRAASPDTLFLILVAEAYEISLDWLMLGTEHRAVSLPIRGVVQ